MFRKCCKTPSTLEVRKKGEQDAKLKRGDTKRIKRKQMIDTIMIEMDAKDKNKMRHIHCIVVKCLLIVV